jgi:Ca2+/Na+ antiporter
MQNMENRGVSLAIIRGATGAVLGAVIGSAIFLALLKIGLYALIVPGALTGMGGAWLSRIYSPVVGVICLVIGAVVTILCEWYKFPFIADDSFIYFVTHLHQLKAMALLLGGIGIVVAFMFGKGNAPSR